MSAPDPTVVFHTIPAAAMRYATLGDWHYTPEGTLRITVAALGDPTYEALVGVHELVEALLCQAHGIAEAAVDAFDLAYEAARPAGDDSEPGDQPAAPYARAHAIATGIEQVLAAALGVDWATYETALGRVAQADRLQRADLNLPVRS